jgi:hypothetical protein
MLLRCHALAGRLALASGAVDEALAEAEAGLSLAAGCGFGLFQGRLAALVARCRLAREPRGAVDAALGALEVTGGEDAWGRVEALRVAGAALEAAGKRARARAAAGGPGAPAAAACPRGVSLAAAGARGGLGGAAGASILFTRYRGKGAGRRRGSGAAHEDAWAHIHLPGGS